MAIANHNFIGYCYETLVRHKVRWTSGLNTKSCQVPGLSTEISWLSLDYHHLFLRVLSLIRATFPRRRGTAVGGTLRQLQTSVALLKRCDTWTFVVGPRKLATSLYRNGCDTLTSAKLHEYLQHVSFCNWAGNQNPCLLASIVAVVYHELHLQVGLSRWIAIHSARLHEYFWHVGFYR